MLQGHEILAHSTANLSAPGARRNKVAAHPSITLADAVTRGFLVQKSFFRKGPCMSSHAGEGQGLLKVNEGMLLLCLFFQ